MAITLNASTMTMNSGAVVQDPSGTNPVYLATRAWVNFNGTGVVAIRASVNVSSITDNGTGDYTVNISTAMTDTNYCAIVHCSGLTTYITMPFDMNTNAYTARATTTYRFNTVYPANLVGGATVADSENVYVAIFR